MTNQTTTEKEQKLTGLGGWLILVGIGVVLLPFLFGRSLLTDNLNMLTSPEWELVTTPGLEFYIPYMKTLGIAELVVNILLLLISLFIVYLFFTQKKTFPRWFMGICIAMPLLVLVDSFAIHQILPNVPLFDGETIRTLIRANIYAAVWVPYMIMSKRVRLTFVR